MRISGTWTPVDTFLLTGWFGIENQHNSSPEAFFDEDSYPLEISAWYSPAPRWSVSGGYAYYTNFITQDITLGDEYPQAPGDSEFSAITLPWTYRGRSQVVNVGASYAWTQCLTLTGGLEWVRGRNAFDQPPAFVRPEDGQTFQWVGLQNNSDVIVQTARLWAGVDYRLRAGVSCYFRYNYFDYEDESVGYNSGTANMLLGGLTAVY